MMEILDDAEIPLVSPGQRARVTEAWIDHLHRGRGTTTNHTNGTNKSVNS